ncbi:MAG: addiction module protein [Phycisphaeraceae bacterium]
MSKTVDEVLADARQLSEKDRAAIAEALLAELDGPVEEGVEEAWAAEAERRLEAYDKGELDTMSIEEVKEAIRARKRT